MNKHEKRVEEIKDAHIAGYKSAIESWEHVYKELRGALEEVHKQTKATGIVYLKRRTVNLLTQFNLPARPLARAISKEYFDRSALTAIYTSEQWRVHPSGTQFSLTRRQDYEPIMAPLILLHDGVVQSHTPRKWNFLFTENATPLFEKWMEQLPQDNYARATLLY